MNLRYKILLGFSAVLALVVVIWAWGIVHIYQLGNASDAILRENYRSILASENMLASLERQDSATLLVVAGERAEGLAQFRLHEVEFLQWLSRAQDNITIEGEAELLHTLQVAYASYLGRFDELIVAVDQEGASVYQERMLPQFAAVRDTVVALRDLNQATMVEAAQSTQRVARWAIWSTVGVGAGVSLVGLVLSLWFSRLLTHPLRAMTRAAEQIADGKYEVSLDVRGKDELGHLAQAIMTMSHKLNAFHRLNVGHLMAEKRRSEAVIQSITDGLIVVDANLMIGAMNPQAEKILGIKAEKAMGEHIFDVVQDQTLYEAIRRVAHGEQDGIENDTEAFFEIGRGEDVAIYRYTVTPVMAEQQKPSGVVLLLQDVTKLKELERLKSDFVMTASHELRTPLTGMAMSLGLLAETTLPRLTERERELMSAAQEEVGRLRALVNDLLDLSKIEAGHMEMHFDTVPPAWLVEKATQLFGEQAAAKRVALDSDITDNLAAVLADPTKITWVLTNLISNALRYTPEGGRIHVTATPGHASVYFAVEDNGPGIPLQFQSRVFDRFARIGDDSLGGGAGLGLAICKEIVKAHQGAIWLESQEGQGCKFIFTLPVVANSALPAHSNDEVTSHVHQATADSHRG